MLTLGGELADGVILDFIHKEFMQDYVDLVCNGATQSGNKPRLCYSTMVITSEAGLEEVRPHMTYRLVDSPSKVKELLGIVPEEINAIRHAMASGGLWEAGKLVKDEWVRPFVIMGSVAECAAELTELMARYNLDEFLLPVLDLKTAPELMAEVAKVMTAT
jgi:alkanesulfonate monooxygenase SsuD/methylene tetrahydromethanopterin reductase-like flavin-dependent oxidoreductase (luciferase family)